ncbi:MAG: hypothetical protein H7319_22975 [Spirosoma sp.]|nr:hypothetical protein [Spirosoma sp.]
MIIADSDYIGLSDEAVILANGGMKTGRTVQDSPGLLAKFRFANKMASQLSTLIQSGELVMNGREITDVEEIDLTD